MDRNPENALEATVPNANGICEHILIRPFVGAGIGAAFAIAWTAIIGPLTNGPPSISLSLAVYLLGFSFTGLIVGVVKVWPMFIGPCFGVVTLSAEALKVGPDDSWIVVWLIFFGGSGLVGGLAIGGLFSFVRQRCARYVLRFRLRTMLLIVTALAIPMAWVGYQLNWIRQRQSQSEKWFAEDMIRTFGHVGGRHDPEAPGWLPLFGERGIAEISFYTDGDLKRKDIERLFPEAEINEFSGADRDKPREPSPSGSGVF